MQETNQMRDALIRDFAENYMEKLFYFCLKKTGKNTEAEDLSQDIALHILSALNKGTVPTNFSAWVWQIARNRYCVWAKDKHDRTEAVTGADIGDYEIEDESENVVEGIIHSEQMALLRRELAFIKSDYRHIIVAYYIENLRVRDIAKSLALSESTVKQRLHRARMILKEGIDMAREFGVRSYKPEQITFTNYCSAFGSKGQPWSVLSHALYKNIFLEAYGNPSTAQDLSLALGVALPYMEDELEFLTKETFLVKNENKYETNFPIISRESIEKAFARQMKDSSKVTGLLESLIDEYTAICESHGIRYYGRYQTYEDAKWTLLMKVLDKLTARIYSVSRERTERPDGGRWDIVGYQQADIPDLPWVGEHGCMDTPEDEAWVQFQQYKFYREGMDRLTPDYLSHKESVTLLQIVQNNASDCDGKVLERLVDYGYVRKTASGYEPAIVVFENGQSDAHIAQFTEEEVQHIRALTAEIVAILQDLFDYVHELNLKDIPASFAKNPKIKDFAASYSSFDRSIVLEQAVADGWIKFDEHSSRAVGAFIYV